MSVTPTAKIRALDMSDRVATKLAMYVHNSSSS